MKLFDMYCTVFKYNLNPTKGLSIVQFLAPSRRNNA